MAVKIEDNTIHSVKGLLFRQDNGLEFLVTKEQDTGLYGFPGGAQDEEDTSIEETVYREVFEELGISKNSYDVTDPHILHKFVHEDPLSPRFGKKGILHILLLRYNGTEALRPSDEIATILWLKPDEVMDKMNTSYDYWVPVFKKSLNYLHFIL